MVFIAEVNPSVDSLYSVARQSMPRNIMKSEEEEKEKAQLQEQAAILQSDDIVDYDSSDEDLPSQRQSQSERAPANATSQPRAPSSNRQAAANTPTEYAADPEIIVIDD